MFNDERALNSGMNDWAGFAIFFVILSFMSLSFNLSQPAQFLRLLRTVVKLKLASKI
jgi:hypothetical protein